MLSRLLRQSSLVCPPSSAVRAIGGSGLSKLIRPNAGIIRSSVRARFMTTTASSQNKSIVDLIIADHATVTNLFKTFKAEKDEFQKRQIGYLIIKELSQHAFLEEEVLYPHYKTKLGARGLEFYEQSVKEHNELAKALGTVDDSHCAATATQKSGCCGMWNNVFKLTEEHVKDEETVVLPEVKKALKEQELIDLGKQYVETKPMMPTHPHPGMAITKGMWLPDRALAAVDSATDAMRAKESPENPPSKKMCTCT